MNETPSPARKVGNWKYHLMGGLIAGLGTVAAWIIVGKLIH